MTAPIPRAEFAAPADKRRRHRQSLRNFFVADSNSRERKDSSDDISLGRHDIAPDPGVVADVDATEAAAAGHEARPRLSGECIVRALTGPLALHLVDERRDGHRELVGGRCNRSLAVLEVEQNSNARTDNTPPRRGRGYDRASLLSRGHGGPAIPHIDLFACFNDEVRKDFLGGH